MNQNTEDVYKQQKKIKGGKIKIIKFRKIILIVGILLLNIITVFNSVQAININSANIVSGGDCGSLLTYKGIVRKIYYAQYIQDGVVYPAYCLDKTKQLRQIHKSNYLNH